MSTIPLKSPEDYIREAADPTRLLDYGTILEHANSAAGISWFEVWWPVVVSVFVAVAGFGIYLKFGNIVLLVIGGVGMGASILVLLMPATLRVLTPSAEYRDSVTQEWISERYGIDFSTEQVEMLQGVRVFYEKEPYNIEKERYPLIIEGTQYFFVKKGEFLELRSRSYEGVELQVTHVESESDHVSESIPAR